VSARAPSNWKLASVALAGLVTGLLGAVLIIESPMPGGGVGFATIAVIICWSFIGAGLVSWKARPESRIGMLLVAVGFTWALNALNGVDVPAIYTFGFIVGGVWAALLLQLLLTFPGGRIETGRERLLVAGGWIAAVGLAAPVLFFTPFPDDTICEGCSSNPILISDSAALAGLFLALRTALAFVVLGGIVVVLVRRWRGATRAQRGSFLPVLWAGGATMALLALQVIASLVSEDVADAVFVAVLVPFLCIPWAFLTGLLRTQLTRDAAVGNLLEQLRAPGVGGEGGGLRDMLAEALGDPSLELGYWLPDSGRWVGQDGESLDVAGAHDRGDRLTSIVEREGRRVGVLLCDPALADQRRLVDAVGAAAALALENERLEAALRARVEELRSSRARLVQATDAERRRLERDLHDGAQQRLVALALDLRMARDKVEQDPAAGAELLDEAMAELELATAELRELARGIHPAVLSDRGLRPAVQALASRAGVPVEVVEVPDDRLASEVEAAAYFVVAEALTNVTRYADAGSATVSLVRSNGSLHVEVSDDGIGGADAEAGSGLRGLSDRVAALDGSLDVDSPAGGGTSVKAVIPCES
jgi:signal transduction histidine kinase